MDAMRRAVKIAQDALEATIPAIKIGMTEKELRPSWSRIAKANGSDPELPFAPIISADPMGQPSRLTERSKNTSWRSPRRRLGCGL